MPLATEPLRLDFSTDLGVVELKGIASVRDDARAVVVLANATAPTMSLERCSDALRCAVRDGLIGSDGVRAAVLDGYSVRGAA